MNCKKFNSKKYYFLSDYYNLFIIMRKEINFLKDTLKKYFILKY